MEKALRDLVRAVGNSCRNGHSSKATLENCLRRGREVLSGSPRKVGEDGACHITIEYGAKALEAVGRPYSIRDAQVVARTLNALLARPSSVPVGESPNEK